MIRNFVKSSKRVNKSFSCFQNEFDLNCYDVKLPFLKPSGNKACTLNCTAVSDFNIKYNLPDLKQRVSLLNNVNSLSPNFLNSVDSMKGNNLIVHGILGIDNLPKFLPCNFVNIDEQNFIKIENGLIPIGSLTNSNAINNVQYAVKIPKSKNGFNSGASYSHVKKATPKEVCCAIGQVLTGNTFDVLPDFVAHHLDNQFSVANSYGEDTAERTPNSYKNFQNSIEFKSGKYHVDVPFDNKVIDKVPNNFAVCKVLAGKVHQKLLKQNLANEYFEIFESQLQEGIIQPLPEQFNVNEYKFVPHRPVIRTDPLVKSTKIRAVFNCSFRNGKTPSLNDSVDFPQDLMKDLVDLFLYFRTNKYFLTADIQKAFLNVKFNRQCDANKFSFIVYHQNKFNYFQYQSAIFGFVLSPFFLQAVLKYHASLQPELDTQNYIANHFYVDNLIITDNSSKNLTDTTSVIYEAIEEGGFHLRDWNSNVVDVTKCVESKDAHVNNSETFKVLGYVLDPVNESFSVKKCDLDIDANTKRAILSGVSSIFDPSGMILPVTTLGKLLMRDITKLKLDWDEVVPKEISIVWARFVKQVAKLQDKINIPRFTYNSDKPFKLHVFADASKDLIACSVYVSQGKHSALLFAKNKLTPIISKTMPTLELLAFELAVKVLFKIVTSEYFNKRNLTEINFYSDSQVALTWILNRFAPKRNLFACNRIKSITSMLSNLTQLQLKFEIYYANTSENVADLISRSLTSPRIMQIMSIYHSGPDWLTAQYPPVYQLNSIPTKYIKDKKLVYAVLDAGDSGKLSSSIVDITRFSSYNKLLNSLAYVFKFIDKLASRPVLSFVHYRAKAFNYLVTNMQKYCFPVEYNYLSAQIITRNPPKLVMQLKLYLDSEGLIRSKGRFNQSALFSYDAANPVLISGSSPLASLLINYAHKECLHMGLNSTLYYLRNMGFWLTRARVSVRKIVGGCMICLKYRAKSFNPPEAGDLPASRIDQITPFSATGLDYTGHFTLIDYSGQYIKAYILLFTCLTTRAVHLEIVPSMTAQHFINAFIRFCNRFGTPREIYSDNARTFLAASNILQSVIHHDLVQNLFIEKHISFKTIPIYSPNQGGSWERLVGLTKQVLHKTYNTNYFKYDHFQTIISDAQNVINNRPLFYNSSAQEIDVVSPNMLIAPNNHFPLLKYSPTSLESVWDQANQKKFLQEINRVTKERTDLNNKFTSEWVRSYILDLRARHGLGSVQRDDRVNEWLTVGSVCLLKIPGLSHHYPLVKIIELFPSKSGQVCNLKVIKADKTTHVVSSKLLAPLEIIDQSLPIDNSQNNGGLEELANSSSNPPKRSAALKQRRLIKELIMTGDI